MTSSPATATALKRKWSSLATASVPTYVLLAGLPATGKSTLARAIVQQLATQAIPSVILNKDDVRAALFPGAATDYSDAQNDLCMEIMLRAADYLRRKPDPPRYIFFDGRTFSHAAHIAPVIAAAEFGASPWRILHLTCSPALAEQRLKDSSHSHPAANRSFGLYQSLLSHFEPIEYPHRVIDTAQPLQQSITEALCFLDKTQLPPPHEDQFANIPSATAFATHQSTETLSIGETQTMDKFAIWAQMEARPGKEAEVEEFLKSAQPMAVAESGTTTWYALKIGPSKYGIFDTFADEDARKAHLSGDIAKALFAKAKDLFVKEPEVDTPTILAAKAPSA